jgi:antitoxin component of RelBE/YafQ-DinJ toxin-antitoxin module
VKTVRVGQELERRLAAKAASLGVTESEVIRMALNQFCEEAPGQRSPFDEMVALIEQWEHEDAGKAEIDVARHSSELFGDQLYEDWFEKQGLKRVAEERARYHTSPAD